MKKILVTGGAGFIGTHTAEYYLKKGDEVTIFDNFSRKGTRENADWLQKEYGDKNLKIVEGDVRVKEALNNLVIDKDLVVHLAAQVAVTTSVKDPRDDFETNAGGTFNVLEAVRNNNPEAMVIYSSTNKVYGEMENLEVQKSDEGYDYKNKPEGIDENQNLDFHSPYGCSKGAAEQYVHDYAKIYGLKTVVFRQSCIYGTRQFGIEDQGWISWFTIASILGKPMTIYGDGYQVRDVLDVEDLVKAYDLAFDKNLKIGIFNIGGGKENALSIRKLLTILENKLGKKIETAKADWRPGDQKVYISDIKKIKKELGWQPEIKVEKGVEKLIDWTNQNRELIKHVLG